MQIMKKLAGFILLGIILWAVFHLIRVHDQEIPLSKKQVSLLNAESYSSSKDIGIVVNEKENAIIERINSLRAAKDMSALKLDKTAALLALLGKYSIC